jgi:hypothetical protein
MSLALFSLAVAIFMNRQLLIDSFLAWQYKPSAEIAAMAERTKLTEKGRFYFFASQPELNDREAFNKACTAHDTEQSVVLGCYTMMRIHVFNINNPKLDGIKEVTAAHEMLHAAYDRLSSSERERIDGLVQAQLNKIADQRILDLVKEYDKTEPGARLNEMHSILGTEVANLDPELETYYQRYFSDRSSVVALADGYVAVFEELKARTSVLLAELTALADSIDRQNTEYRAAADQLNSEIEAFNRRARSGQMTREEFDSERGTLEAKQQSLQSFYDSIKADIALYDAKRGELESINTESEILNRSIDSKLSPVPSI